MKEIKEIIVINAPVHRFGQGAQALKLIPSDTALTTDLGVIKPDGSFFPPNLQGDLSGTLGE